MAQHRIAVVSRLTGLAPDTIRKWESRHNVVAPARDGNGMRRYSDADVRRLRELCAVVELGYPIGEAAALKPKALIQALAAERPELSSPHVRSRGGSADSIMRAVLLGLRRHDAEQIDRMLSAASHLLTPAEFVFEVMSPLFREIGEAWRRGEFSIGQEHLFSAISRSVLGNYLRRFSTDRDAPALIFTTLPGDPHEFGILLAAMLAASQGWRVHYLGPSMPLSAAARTASEVRVRAVVLGSARSRRSADVVRAVAGLASALPAGVEVWFGGKAPPRLGSGSDEHRVVTVPTLQDFLARVRLPAN